MADSCYIDGFGPLPCVRPADRSELAEIVRAAPAHGALYPFGGFTQISLGNPPTRPGHAVDLRSLAQVVDFPARDMTVTVEAGLTVAMLQQLTATENLRLPVDVPRAKEATVGGILATNVSGPRRLGFGTLRDYVIGISAINDEGREFKAGGRVVKNVAGYDLCKLLVGALGTLGIIMQATFKLRPLAEEQALVTLGCEPAHLENLLAKLHGSRTRPVALEVLNQAAASLVFGQAGLPSVAESWVAIVGYEGNQDAVNWQVQQLLKELAGVTSLQVRIGFTAEPLWQSLIEFNLWPESKLTFKANLQPSATATFAIGVSGLDSTVVLRGHAGSGIVVGHLVGDWTKERAAAVLAGWRELAGKGRGRAIVLRCPPEWKNVISVWGPIGGDAWLMREVKEKFDPRGIFNPGRFYHGI